MISDQIKNPFVIKHIYISVFMLYFSCAGRSEFDVETLEIPIPKSWQTPFPEKKDFVGEWCLSFQDSALID